MSNFSRQVKRNQARERQKMAKRRMKENRGAVAQNTEAQLWQAKYDQKVEEVAMLKGIIGRNEAMIAALIIDNTPNLVGTITDETVELISSGGVQGFNRNQVDGGVTVEVVLSPDVEEVDDDDADVLSGQDEAEAGDTEDESEEE